MVEKTPVDSEGQGSLARCSPWGGTESDMTKSLNNNTTWEIIKTLMRPWTGVWEPGVKSPGKQSEGKEGMRGEKGGTAELAAAGLMSLSSA